MQCAFSVSVLMKVCTDVFTTADTVILWSHRTLAFREAAHQDTKFRKTLSPVPTLVRHFRAGGYMYIAKGVGHGPPPKARKPSSSPRTTAPASQAQETLPHAAQGMLASSIRVTQRHLRTRRRPGTTAASAKAPRGPSRGALRWEKGSHGERLTLVFVYVYVYTLRAPLRPGMKLLLLGA